MTQTFNSPPGWPTPPAGWTPPEGWRPEPSWPPAPADWQWWRTDPQVDPPAHAPASATLMPAGAVLAPPYDGFATGLPVSSQRPAFDPGSAYDPAGAMHAPGMSPFAMGPSAERQAGKRGMLIGGGIAAAGLAVTGLTYAFAAPGGTFTVLWGAVLWGVVGLVRGAVQYHRG